MNRRLTYVENRRVLTDSGVIVSQLNVRDPITTLYFEIRATNGATSNKGNPIPTNVQAIELLDGANVLFSLTGPQAFAYGCYKAYHVPYMMVDEGPGSVQTLAFHYFFGRWPGDTAYALDPSKFDNLQLRLTWNLATTRAVGAAGFATGTGLYTIMADVMEGAPTPQAMLSTKQHYQFVTVNGATNYIDLPVDRRLRSILIRSAANLWGGFPGIGNVKLTADQDKFIVMDMRLDEVQAMITAKNPPFWYKHFFFCHNGETLLPLMKYDENLNLEGFQGDVVHLYTNNGAGFGVFNQLLAGVADNNDRSYVANVGGNFPMHTAQLDLGEWDDPSSWLDTTQFRSLQLQLRQDQNAGAASVVIEQEKVY
jgi:hypothetical protein